MRSFKFIGDPLNNGDGPDVSTTYGVTFRKHGDALEVPDEYAHKFAGNRHFEEHETNPPMKRGPGRPKKIIETGE